MVSVLSVDVVRVGGVAGIPAKGIDLKPEPVQGMGELFAYMRRREVRSIA